jgi:hypothetical protein
VTFNEQFFDASLRHQIDLLRFGSGVARKVNAVLDETQADLRRQVERRLGKVTGITGASLKRLRELERAIDQQRSGAWNDVTESWTRTAVDVALEEPMFVAGALTSILPIELDLVQPSPATLRALATTRPFQGRHLKEWAQSAQRADLTRIHQQIRIGMVQGEAARDIAARVFGARGATNITRHQAEAVTRTVINGVSNAAQQEFLQANSDLFQVEQLVATLDARTCWSPNTLITMANGSLVPIGELREGDWVIGGTSGAPCRVIGVTRSCEASSVAIYLQDEFAGRTTREHRLLTPDGWRHAESFGLLTDVPEREVICRRLQSPGKTDAGARSAARSCGDNGGNSGVRAAGADGAGDGRLEATGIPTGGGVRPSSKDADSERLQRHEGWRRRDGSARAHSARGGAAVQRAVSYGSGVSGDNAPRVRGSWPEDCGQEQGILRDGGGQGPDEGSRRQRVACQHRESQSQTEGAKDADQDVGGHQESVAGPGVSPESESRARGQASGAAQGSGLGPKEAREGCCHDASEVAGPGVCGQDANASGLTREACEACGGWEEGLPESLVEEGTERRRIRAELAGPTEIVSLSIEGDESYVAGGIIVHNTPICRAQDGKQYPVGKGPMPPLHVACRSIRVAVLNGEVIGERPFKAGTEQQMLREYAAANGLGNLSSRDDLPRGHKRAFDEFSRRRMRELTGQVPAKTTYQQWLAKQHAEIQDDILGPTRAKLFREGGLTLDRFVGREGDELTLEELRRRNREAWERAGLGTSAADRRIEEQRRREAEEDDRRRREQAERLRREADEAERRQREERERREAAARAEQGRQSQAEDGRRRARERANAQMAKMARAVDFDGPEEWRVPVSNALERAGAGRMREIGLQPMGGLSVTTGPAKPGANGYYRPSTQTVVAGAPLERDMLAEHRQSGQKDSPRGAWSSAYFSPSTAESAAATAVHEFGHHLHYQFRSRGKLLGDQRLIDADRTIQDTYRQTVTEQRPTGAQGPPTKDPAGKAPTRYARHDYQEFWSESLAIYHTDRSWLQREKPESFAMVETVLGLIGLK